MSQANVSNLQNSGADWVTASCEFMGTQSENV